MDHPRTRDRYTPFFALSIIVVGLILLLRNLEVIRLGHRWWALFFLIPIAYLMSDLLQGRQNRRTLIGLVAIISIMVIFLLGVSWSIVWPVFIIIGGLSFLLSR
jgi:cell wall-active antibiotic response 4TMS protein YvqF